MNKKEIQELKEIIKEEEKQYDFNDFIFNYIDEDDLKNLDKNDLRDFLENLNEDEGITRTEVIYYGNAIEYLKKYDDSLEESLQIAEGCDFTLKNLNSEVLASLLKSQNNSIDYQDFINHVIEKFD